ncbi:MAG: TldD/PmbA family protein [Chloroflexota bacterium]|nr:TldD/PmbA family protein [Chloroflexota bacterium]
MSEEILNLLSSALHASQADETELVAEQVHQGVTRYAGSRIHQTTVLDETRVWARAAIGKSVGQASGSSLEPEALRRLIEDATAVARMQAPNPHFTSLVSPEPVRSVQGYDPATAEMGSMARAAAIGEIAAQAADRGWTVSGTYLTEGRELAVANSHGVAVWAPSSLAFLRALPDSGAGTGYADTLSHHASDLGPADVMARAAAKCRRNRDQREVPPGEYVAIFDDLGVAEMLLYLARHGFNGQSYEEGTSFMSGRLGERVTGENVTIWDDGTDPRGLAIAVDYEGLPKRHLSLLEEGRAVGVAYDSDAAGRAGATSTGHALEPEYRSYGSWPSNLFMAGGKSSVEEMIRGTERGLLVTRFHYTHCPDPKRVVMTGTTRDGTFLIEDGQIVGAVRNLRLTQSIPELFEGIEALGKPRLCRDWWCSNGMGRLSYVCPPIKVQRAVFDSGTLF